MKRVLCVLENGFEEIETVAPVDVLRRAGVEVVMAGVPGNRVEGKCGIIIVAERLLDEVAREDFDALVLPGGPAVMELRKNRQVIDLIKRHAAAGKPIAAICAAPLLLHQAGLLAGKSFTGHFTITEELPENSGERVVRDGELLTSRGAGTAVEFGLALVEMLVGREKADEVGKSIMV